MSAELSRQGLEGHDLFVEFLPLEIPGDEPLR